MNPERKSKLVNFIRHTLTAVSNASLYASEHPQVRRMVDLAFTELGEAMAVGGGFSLLLIEGEVVLDGSPLKGSIFLGRFARALNSRGVGHLKIVPGVGRGELAALVNDLAGRGENADEIFSTKNISVGRVEVRFGGGGGEEAAERESIPLTDIQQREMAILAEMREEAQKRRKLNVVGLSDMVDTFIDAFRQEADSFLALSPLRAMDEYTYTHSTNICILNLAQAMALGIEGPLLRDIGVAALLHDVGKLFVPLEVLNKPGRLEAGEFELIKQHPGRGARYLLETPGVPHLAVVTAFEHHLKLDLSGYPRVPAGWKQGLASHMTTISDIFDALRTKRPYGVAMSNEKIIQILLRMSGTQLHPVLTSNFLALMERLDDGGQE